LGIAKVFLQARVVRFTLEVTLRSAIRCSRTRTRISAQIKNPAFDVTQYQSGSIRPRMCARIVFQMEKIQD
jgi:hypothetical protein